MSTFSLANLLKTTLFQGGYEKQYIWYFNHDLRSLNLMVLRDFVLGLEFVFELWTLHTPNNIISLQRSHFVCILYSISDTYIINILILTCFYFAFEWKQCDWIKISSALLLLLSRIMWFYTTETCYTQRVRFANI